MDQRAELMDPFQCWAIVLAGGEGRRMSPAVCDWLGENCPKQYCTFVGTRSMLEHTWDRCAQLVDESRTLTVIGTGHRRFLSRYSCGGLRGSIVEQPCARGTLPGLLLPLAQVMAIDPKAVVHVLPSDHYVFPEKRFRRIARASGLLASCRPDRVVLLGARPDGPESDYGWIRTGNSNGSQAKVHKVSAFVEKPPEAIARRLYEEGGFWNTMIIAARARLLWDISRELFPEMLEKFEELRQLYVARRQHQVKASTLRKAVERVYEGIVAADLSRHLLEKIPERLLLLAMDQIEWSDWGRPARISETLRRLGKEPYFAGHGRQFGVPNMATQPTI